MKCYHLAVWTQDRRSGPKRPKTTPLMISGEPSLEKRGLSQKGSFCYHFSA